MFFICFLSFTIPLHICQCFSFFPLFTLNSFPFPYFSPLNAYRTFSFLIFHHIFCKCKRQINGFNILIFSLASLQIYYYCYCYYYSCCHLFVPILCARTKVHTLAMAWRCKQLNISFHHVFLCRRTVLHLHSSRKSIPFDVLWCAGKDRNHSRGPDMVMPAASCAASFQRCTKEMPEQRKTNLPKSLRERLLFSLELIHAVEQRIGNVFVCVCTTVYHLRWTALTEMACTVFTYNKSMYGDVAVSRRILSLSHSLPMCWMLGASTLCTIFNQM